MNLLSQKPCLNEDIFLLSVVLNILTGHSASPLLCYFTFQNYRHLVMLGSREDWEVIFSAPCLGIGFSSLFFGFLDEEKWASGHTGRDGGML
jgi:hypothetical protein